MRNGGNFKKLGIMHLTKAVHNPEKTMNCVLKIVTPSGDKVLGKCSPKRVRFNAYAFKAGYAAANVVKAAKDAADYLSKESAAVSTDLFCGIRVEKA